MGWNKITIDTLTSAEDMISYELTELGATGVEVEDHVSLTEEEMKVMYVDLLPDDIAPDDGKAKKKTGSITGRNSLNRSVWMNRS